MLRSVTALAAFVLTATASPAAVVTKVVEYDYEGVKLKGFLAFDDAVKEKRPGVLVVHEWWGLDDYAKGRCKQLAELGYVAFAPDMYGEGKVVNHPDDSGKMARAVRANVQVWRGRADAGLKQLQSQPNVDGGKLAAIGYCFGGSTCLQLAYSGADLKAVATFHAALPKPTEAEAKAIKPKLLICHGEADPLISPQAIKDFRGALDGAGTKYEFVAYKDVVHSFTVPGADAHNIKGMKYDKHADEDSWKKMLALFKDTLGR
ncbi:Dienelactone hydrolase family protein [Gemmata obscuriglobus]|uniref:Dienelactone hydrolase family protein n=1 Tax=Gemmata obscuriglobus TaxID=114 RepID=A0A2Z3GXH5_9BACT|nr:dienelactone hydrolase family protein [Gemmata obscuriglobus]AWM36712.1 dienelactone hydrolase family protein [Gemmata obscuriglobus]QEG30639.1 Dienelactone hydrolase family protein [Gemmata obscuriglobus]VTS09966.1 dienelactone hydrolase : Dienelactone hydrolase OS=Thiocapsa marina 5811 GN=ThimaDRAFT_3961 PE=4 SV=1: DLH [Gemmata obscuriglobus UQM 2246]